MEDRKNTVVKSYRFPDRTPGELGTSPALDDAFILEAKWYDERGQLIRREDFEADGSVNEADTYIFNEKGLITEHKHFMNGEMTECTNFVYNEMGMPMQEERSFAEGGVQRTLFAYDKEGRLIRKTFQDEEGNEEGYETQEWLNGNLVKREIRDLGMESGEIFEMSYAEVDRKYILKEEKHTEIPAGVMYRTVYHPSGYTTFDGRGSRYASHKKVLDEKGRLAESHYSTLQRDISSFYTYDEEGRLQEEKRKLGGNDNYHARFTYAQDGSLLMAHITEASSGTFTDIFIRGVAQES